MDGRTAEEKLLDNGYDDVPFLTDEGYDSALIAVTDDNRAVYDYDKMVEDLCTRYGWTAEEAIEWIEYNTLRALPYFGEDAPVVIHMLE